MSAPARSLAVWSVYALSVGLLLLVVPNFLLGLFQIEETSESWVRVLGSTVILLAIYYVYIVRENSVGFESHRAHSAAIDVLLVDRGFLPSRQH